MIRKLFSLLICLTLTLALAAPALAETADEWVTVPLNNGGSIVAPADFYVLTPGMTDEDLAPLGLTAAYVDQLLTSQNMQADCLAPDVNCEYMISIVPYEFTDFADCLDLVLKAAIPTLETTLAPGGVTIDEYEIMRWESEDGSDKDAYIVMYQTQTDANGTALKRLHGYSAKDGYGINLILIAYTTEITEAQAELFSTVMASIVLPQ